MSEVSLSPLRAAAAGPTDGPTDLHPPEKKMHPYLQFLSRLHAKWKDVPQLTVAFDDVSVVFQSSHVEASKGDHHSSGAHADEETTITEDSIPTLASTLKHYAMAPIELIAAKTGMSFTPTLYAMKKASGVIRPGTMTLVLAPPGHGKSTLLKALSGRLPSSNIRGSLKYNGVSRDDLSKSGVHVSRLASYVAQTDLHFPTLTVLETIKFASDSCVPMAELLGDSELVALEEKRAEMLISMIGLEECRHTVVGNDMLRGVSGGQKKRVTLGEMIVGNARLMCLDEVSTGLDAAVTASIFGSLKQVCRISGSSVVTSLLQPTPETYDLFDDVILMHEGCIIYHGPRVDIPRWLWTECGLDVPVDVDVASFLCDFLVSPRAANEAATRLAQAASFIESTRESRKADAATDPTLRAAVREGPEAGPDANPKLYDHYKTFTEAPEQSCVRFHVEADEADAEFVTDAAVAHPTITVTSPAGGRPDTLAAPRRKGLGRGVYHSRAGGAPINRVRDLEPRRSSSEWWIGQQSALSSLKGDTAGPASMDKSHWSAYTKSNFGSVYPHSYGHHLRLCFSRQFKLFIRNLTVMVPRMCKALSIGLFYGLLFFRLGYDASLEKLAVCMYGAIYACMTNLSELPVASEARNVVAKQLDAGFFPSSPYTFAVQTMHIPMTAVESICYGTLIYFISGLDEDAGRYFFYLFVCFLCSNAMAAFYRSISYITPNPDIAKQLDLPFVVLFLIFNGYIVSYKNVPVWLRYWAFWITPLHWGTKALTLNEYDAPKYDTPSPYNPDQRIGDYYLGTFDMPTEYIFKWMGVLYLGCYYIIWTFGCILCLNTLTLVSPQGSVRPSYDEAPAKAADDQSQRAQIVPSPKAGPQVAIQMPTGANLERAKSQAGVNLGALPFTPVTLAWGDLNYTIPLPDKSTRVLLQSVSGFAKPGQMTALMGASGAGKTTLMDCIAGRKTTGTMTADIRVNGQPVDIHSPYFQQLCGYVEQFDMHMGTSTVREALRFSAKLRLPTSITEDAQHHFVDEVMELLGLAPFAHAVVGDASIQGLSPAQLKLLTIGVELVANPAILFLDEPTSGLDSPAAWRVMNAIKRITLTGRTVLCTIHQPAARLFLLFDSLLLLQPGGKTIYSHAVGARGETLVSYFEAACNFEHRLPAGINPANWMLEISAQPHQSAEEKAKNVSKPVRDWSKLWTESGINQQLVLPEVKKQLDPASFTAVPADKSADDYPGWWSRYWVVQVRLFQSYWRNGPMNITRGFVCILLGFLIGVVYYRVRPTDYTSLISFISAIYMSCGFGPSLACTAALPTLYRQRAVYYRESTVRMYDYLAYSLSLTVCEFVAQFVLQFIYVLPLYWLIGLINSGTQFWNYFFIIFLLSQFYAFVCQFYLAFLPNQVSASVVHSIVFSFLFVFGGLLVHARSIPKGWRWFYHMIPTPKAFIALALPQLHCSGGGFGCGSITPPGETDEVNAYDYIASEMENSYESWGNQVGWIFLMLFSIRCLTLIGFRFISHLKR